MAKVLVYYSSNNRTIAIETQVFMLLELGHEVHFISQSEKGPLFTFLTKILNVRSPLKYPVITHFITKIQHLFFILRYCQSNNIDWVISHLQHANIYATVASLLFPIKYVVFRHHDHAKTRKEKFIDRLINRLTKMQIVPSNTLMNKMVREENVDPQKIKVIPYIYQFEQYAQPDSIQVEKIKKLYKCEVLLLVASRMIPSKRHDLAIRLTRQLIDFGLDVKLVLADSGPSEKNYEQQVTDLHLSNHVFFLGYVNNLMDYLSACDILIHPSNNDVSSSLVKEAGYMSKPVVICRQAGDFDEYIEDEVSGMVCDIECQLEDMVSKTRKLVEDPELVISLGKNLKKKVENKFAFSSEKLNYYRDLLS